MLSYSDSANLGILGTVEAPTDTLRPLLDRVAELHKGDEMKPVLVSVPKTADSVSRTIGVILGDRQLRPEHRARIYKDVVADREQILLRRDSRYVDLIFWGEHVESLVSSKKRGRLDLFSFTRAFEATVRRCGFDLLPCMGKLDKVSDAWAEREYDDVFAMLSADVVEVEPPGETPDELHA